MIKTILRKRILMPLLVIMAILAAILPCAICLAQALPDSGPSINAIYAFQNLAQSGDQLYLIDETTLCDALFDTRSVIPTALRLGNSLSIFAVSSS